MDWLYVTGSLFRELNTNRLRRFLSILGVIIGTGAVISSLAVVEGGRLQLRAYLNKLGVNVVYLEDRYDPHARGDVSSEVLRNIMDKKRHEEEMMERDLSGRGTLREGRTYSPSFSPGALRTDTLSLRDVAFLRERFPEALFVEPQMIRWTDVGRVGRKPFKALVEGGTPAASGIRDLAVREGRYLCLSDVEKGERVCVLGARIAEKLCGSDPAVGRTIVAFGSRWVVVGVLAPKGSMMRFDYDELVIVPLTAMQERAGIRLINGLLIRARDTRAALAIDRNILDEVLARLHGREPEEFKVFCQDELMKQKEQTLHTFQVLAVAIAAFSLLVSGIGIMNIMLVSVRERTREVGVWKAVGATDGDVLLYFLAESVLTCLLGGALGILLGLVLGAEAASLIAGGVAETSEWEPVFRIRFVLLAFGTAALVGLLSGLFPAYVAARLEPVEALRYE